MKKYIGTLIICLTVTAVLKAQTFYVDPVKGSDQADGSSSAPFGSIKKAAEYLAHDQGNTTVIIKLLPGLYILDDKVILSREQKNISTAYIIEAAVMPDDVDWTPSKMPVIQSVSGNNSVTQFPHAAGFLVATGNVQIRGLKFVGNTNPATKYYYPVTREDTVYAGLDISQCYFIGERNSAPIQGAVWAHGHGTTITHCIFYGCKNALLLFNAIRDFSVTHSIIYGAYEAAVWFGPYISDFVFENNIVTQCNFFWLRPEGTYPEYKFSNSLITNNKYFMGVYLKSGGLAELENRKQIENNIRRSGSIILSEVALDGMQRGYLNLSPGSDGHEYNAGLFTTGK
ncbi:MAG TPA: right-handed parallel beta-helix repeat-containing protein [Niabella sp.]